MDAEIEASSKDAELGTNGVIVGKRKTYIFSRRQWITLLLIGMGDCFIVACTSLQAPFFPKEATKKGASGFQYGSITAVFSLTKIIMAPMFGKSVRWIPPKYLISCGAFSTGTCWILFGFFDKVPNGTPFVTVACIFASIAGVGFAAYETGIFTMLAAEYSEATSTAFSIVKSFTMIGFLIGPLLGGVLFQLQGFTLPYVVNGSLLVISSLVLATVLPTTRSKMKESGNLLDILCDTGMFLDIFAATSCFTTLGFIQMTLEPHIRQFNLSSVIIGALFAIIAFLFCLNLLMWDRFIRKGLNPKIAIMIGCLSMTLCLSFIGPAPFIPLKISMWLVCVCLFFLSIGVATKQLCSFTDSFKEVIARGFPDDVVTYGAVGSIFTSCSGIGISIGPVFGGLSLDYIGYENGTMGLIAIEVLLFVFTFVYYWHITGASPRRKDMYTKLYEPDTCDKVYK